MNSESAITLRNAKMGDVEAASEFCRMTAEWSWDKYMKDTLPREALNTEIENLSSRTLKEVVSDSNSFVILALDDSSVVGIAIGKIHGRSGLAEVRFVAVHPGRHHEGIGMNLLVSSEEYLRKKGVHKITINTLPSLTPAIRLYMKFGLLPEAFLRNAWWGADYLVMSKWIGQYKKK